MGRRFSGAGGSLYALGERLSFSDQPLRSDDGWDWRAPQDVSYWLTEPLEFNAQVNGEWIRFEPVEVFHCTGRVGFPRNLNGCTVLASGACLTSSHLCDSSSWALDQEAAISDVQTFDRNIATKIIGFTALLKDAVVPIQEVLVRLPTTGGGMFTGVGSATQVGSDVQIVFNKEGVSFDFH